MAVHWSWSKQARVPVTSQVVDLVVTLLFLFPEGEVLLEELNDALSVTEVVLFELVDLVESLLESVISELTGLGVILEDLVVEDGEVEGKSELDGVAGGKIDFVSFFVSLFGLHLDILELGVLGVLGDVAVVVTDHLDEEGLGLTVTRFSQNLVVDHVNDTLAIVLEFAFDSLLISGKSIGEF